MRLSIVSATPSHPSRGAWIEIPQFVIVNNGARRTPHGVRGLKFYKAIGGVDVEGRTPHGVRGLK